MSVEPRSRNAGDIARDYSSAQNGFIKNLMMKPDASKVISDTLSLMFYPNEVREALKPVYNTFSPAGFSGEFQNFDHTSGPDVSFEMFMNSLIYCKDNSGVSLDEAGELIEQSRRFLEALCYPAETPSGVITGDNATVIVCLPGLLTLRMKIQNVGIVSRVQDQKGRLREMTFGLTFKEAPMGKITMRDHLDIGMFRTWGN